MKYTEMRGNVFESPLDFSLCHCISCDRKMGAGIARPMDKTFNLKNRMKTIWGEPKEYRGGHCLYVPPVFNLVTKPHYYDKPTLSSLKESLLHMKEIMDEVDATKIASPKIGCGLDKLYWNDVSNLIQEVFADVDELEWRVYYL